MNSRIQERPRSSLPRSTGFANNLDRISSCFLRSGHTHEDVDQLFGTLSKHLLKYKDLQDGQDVLKCIEAFLSNAKMPFEGERHCVFLNNPRDWTFGLDINRRCFVFEFFVARLLLFLFSSQV